MKFTAIVIGSQLLMGALVFAAPIVSEERSVIARDAVAAPAPITIEVKRDAEAIEELSPEYDIVKGVCHKLKRALEYLL
ncbi:MAG: hypothetical protein MMC33_006526 [Icmadophila ericetorum]|nr:hypothetical protein [Icmadophila ericetorum]